MHQRPASAAAEGFTLVELLVATAIISVIMLGVHQGFSAALVSWHRAESNLDAADEARRFMGGLSSELRCLVVLPLSEGEAAFEADPDRLTFLTTSGLGDRSVKPGLNVSRVTYEILRPAEPGAQGEQISVRRTRQFYSGSQPIAEQAAAVVLEGIRRLKFYYLAEESLVTGFQWQENWQSNPEPPRAVRVELQFKRGVPPGEGQASLFRTLVQVHVRSPLE